MRFDTLDDYLASPGPSGTGPLAAIFVEDEVEVEATLRHHLGAGFARPLVMIPDEVAVAPETEALCDLVPWSLSRGSPPSETVNRVIDAVPDGRWIYYCHNAEFLFFPFSGTRRIGELATFVTEERRESVLTYVIDLYAGDLSRAPHGVNLSDADLDRAGYYALSRNGPDGLALDRQLDFYGGLRWRFEEHVPESRRRIDRISLFRARTGRRLLPDHRLEDEELNTYACRWHNSPTAAIASFRTAKALRTNPGSRSDVHQFRWHGSERFEWKSRQLMEHGLMEPGQWF